ncbi:phosphoenolpyruvate hydrolase family protein [Propionicicella superfundia]|uniref:phosphoenolpyruvate hydrolase family protein n=1 Tax=Propionicicella superfundia TaxID=348582 RepID=UPI0004011E89|nr:phosphoenolpyruvate hydrolase family protein [Propionicicella superfundia]
MSAEPLIAVGVGCGLTAAGAVAGGADLLACYSTAVYRSRGLPSVLAFLPYEDPNRAVADVLPDVVAAAGTVPVFAGIGAHDPRWRPGDLVRARLDQGAVGVMNEPFVGVYSGDLRTQLEAAGLGYARELDLAREATRAGALVLGWAWNPQEAAAMAATGASHVGLMLGITAGGRLGSEPGVALAESLDLLAEMAAAARRENPDAITIVHGGPLHDPEGVAKALAHSGADGYLGGSSLERLPVLEGMSAAVRAFRGALART